MGLAIGRKTLAPTAGVGAALTVAGVLFAAALGRNLLWPFVVIAIGLTMTVAGLFGRAVMDTGKR